MLSVAYISNGPVIKANRPSKKDRIHADAIITLAITKANDKKKALITFANELLELEALRQKLNKLQNVKPNSQ